MKHSHRPSPPGTARSNTPGVPASPACARTPDILRDPRDAAHGPPLRCAESTDGPTKTAPPGRTSAAGGPSPAASLQGACTRIRQGMTVGRGADGVGRVHDAFRRGVHGRGPMARCAKATTSTRGIRVLWRRKLPAISVRGVSLPGDEGDRGEWRSISGQIPPRACHRPPHLTRSPECLRVGRGVSGHVKARRA